MVISGVKEQQDTPRQSQGHHGDKGRIVWY